MRIGGVGCRTSRAVLISARSRGSEAWRRQASAVLDGGMSAIGRQTTLRCANRGCRGDGGLDDSSTSAQDHKLAQVTHGNPQSSDWPIAWRPHEGSSEWPGLGRRGRLLSRSSGPLGCVGSASGRRLPRVAVSHPGLVRRRDCGVSELPGERHPPRVRGLFQRAWPKPPTGSSVVRAVTQLAFADRALYGMRHAQATLDRVPDVRLILGTKSVALSELGYRAAGGW